MSGVKEGEQEGTMRDKYAIGLDFGTLSGRGVLVRCRDGEIISTAEKSYAHGVITGKLSMETGAVHQKGAPASVDLSAEACLQNPQDYLKVLDVVIPSLLQDSGIFKEDIIGIGVDFTASTILPLDAKGVPLCMNRTFGERPHGYVKLWKHHGAQKQTDQINRVLADKGWDKIIRFGGAVSPELLVPKALEIMEEDPDLYKETAEIIEAGDWITRVLTGSTDRSCSMAGYKAWWNDKDGYPDNEFYLALNSKLDGFVKDKLPGKVRTVGEPVGHLTQACAKRLGLTEGIPVAAAVIDSHAGVPGCGVCRIGQAMLVLGTSSVLIALSEKPYAEKGIYGSVRDGIVPGCYAWESGLAAVGDLLDWFATNCVSISYQVEAQAEGVDIHTLLSRKAEQLPIGASGLLALDWWNGNKTPFVDSNLSGSLVGLTLQTKAEELYRALIEATAFATRTILELYRDNGVAVDEIVASGGISYKNPIIMQIYADVLGVDIRIADSEQAAALGSSIYAALAAGERNGGYNSYTEAVKQMSRVKEQVYHYSASNKLKYDKLYMLYQRFSDIMGKRDREILKELHTLKIFAR